MTIMFSPLDMARSGVTWWRGIPYQAPSLIGTLNDIHHVRVSTRNVEPLMRDIIFVA